MTDALVEHGLKQKPGSIQFICNKWVTVQRLYPDSFTIIEYSGLKKSDHVAPSTSSPVCSATCQNSTQEPLVDDRNYPRLTPNLKLAKAKAIVATEVICPRAKTLIVLGMCIDTEGDSMVSIEYRLSCAIRHVWARQRQLLCRRIPIHLRVT